jgi:two-component system KDP operon response regulator KdpE
MARALRERGFVVHLAHTGADALRVASVIEPDLVLLDLGLPDMHGADVCRRLRRWMRNPILVVTVDDGEGRKVEILDDGADDYITKPFSFPEMLARVRVALRHREALARAYDPTVIAVGDLVLDEAAHTAAIRDIRLSLTRKEFALLALLARGAGRVLTHASMLTDVWGEDAIERVEYLRTHVAQLRRKLTAASSTVSITSEPGVGYRLVDAASG